MSDSSSDDDYYGNWSKYKQKHTVRPPVYVPSQSSTAQTLSADSDHDDILETDGATHSSLNDRLKRMTKANPPKAADVEEVDDIILSENEDIRVESVGPKKRITQRKTAKTLRSAPITENNISPLMKTLQASILEDEIAFKQSEKERRRKEAEYEEEVDQENERSVCSITLRDMLEVGPELTFKWDINATFSDLVAKYAKPLRLNEAKAQLWGNDGTKRFPLGSTPLLENFSQTSPNVIEYVESKEEVVVTNPNDVELKWQIKGQKPLLIGVDKTLSFAAIRKVLEEEHKMGKIAKFIFDCEVIDDDQSPDSLEMEGGDCVDVYLS